ncbi:hypothetical protein VU06_04535, partial [Desulfobulbus sp. F3]|nr:hypothetical protein [Desulfobulbus sp. F3]
VGHPFPYPANWADVKIAVNSTGWTAYSPSAAAASGYVSKIYYRWSGSAYEPKDDATPGMTGILQPQEAIWVRSLPGASTLGAGNLKVLIPAR